MKELKETVKGDEMKKHTIESDFYHLGLRCIVIQNHRSGYRCGYVGVSMDHFLHGINYHEETWKLGMFSSCRLQQEVNGEDIGWINMFCCAFNGVTSRPDIMFSVHGGLTYSGGGDYPIEGDWWWFGYDCGHLDDRADVDLMDEKMKEIHVKFHLGTYGIIRSKEYCENECIGLAEQLKAADDQFRFRREILNRKF